jgi:CRISPR/Cas system-associated exonuclease Cas4 (RecB family)
LKHVFSFTSLSLYEKCPYCYWLKYVGRFPLPATIDITGTLPGSVCHKLAELFYKDGARNWDIFRDNFEPVFQKYLKKRGIYLKKGAFATSEASARKFIQKCVVNLVKELDKNKLYSGFFIPEGSLGFYGSPFHFTPEIGLMGGWDLLIGPSRDSPLTLIDYKASDSTFRLDRRQLFFYAVGAEAMMNIQIKNVMFILFKKKGQTIPYPFDDQVRESTREWINRCADRIDRKDFIATPGKFSCGLCPYKTMCKQSYKEPKHKVEGPVDWLPQGDLI